MTETETVFVQCAAPHCVNMTVRSDEPVSLCGECDGHDIDEDHEPVDERDVEEALREALEYLAECGERDDLSPDLEPMAEMLSGARVGGLQDGGWLTRDRGVVLTLASGQIVVLTIGVQ